MDKKIVDYRVAHGNSLYIAVSVCEDIRKGWQPIGGVSVEKNGDYCQAMVRYVEPDGLSTAYYTNGQKEKEGIIKDGKRIGEWTFWYENGQKQTEGTFKDDKQDGKWIYWHENGQKSAEGTYKDGKPGSSPKFWNEDGSVKE